MNRFIIGFIIVTIPLQLFARDRFSDLQSEIDDLRQKVHCYQVERDILEEKIHKQESLLTKMQKDVTSSKTSTQELSQTKFSQYEARLSAIEEQNASFLTDLKQLKTHANETTASLGRFNTKISDLDSQVTKLKESMQTLLKLVKKGAGSSSVEIKEGATTYKIKAGDSLDKIAKATGLSVSELKKLNSLSSDKIVVGKELVLE